MRPKPLEPQVVLTWAAAAVAAGGSMLAVMEELVSRGASPSNIRIVAVLAAPPALKALSEKYPGASAAPPRARPVP